jgi:pimeloyl-ACP methyl ester carboxylesterase
MSLIVFSHGNSFPASTYGVMIASLKKRGFSVKSIDKLGHDPKYPVTDNWPHLVQQLADFVERETDKAGTPAYLVGHSLGGILSLMCAAKHPALACGVVLVDAPVIGGWRASTLGAIKTTNLVGRISPGAVSQHRKQAWPDADAVYAHFKSKRAFALWDDAVLRDYVNHGTHDVQEDGKTKRHLSFDRHIETHIYNTIPDSLERHLKRHPLKCPAAFVGGLQSQEMKTVGTALTAKVTHGRMAWMDGTHLFPMEKPLAAAAAIEAAISGFALDN